ncbi:unnamed protein product [Zymoseptoria tritici ST99CH_1A5]|uniref:Uncharacterized protein n=1 Tax=Zymoseptoria tritici ST99CH_1A5 TaxID=1276529 RepID=A0A1Y6L584_ZYMTR|nr:unnamed protein product [Zymoseptoria tritici ST99CH_1A5]
MHHSISASREANERVNGLCRQNVTEVGCAALTALNELDRVGQLKKDSRFLDLGHVMAMFLLWSKTATGMTVEGRIRHDPYDDDDAELEIYEWVGPLLAYAAKADIDLAEQRVSGIDKVLKRTTVGGLRGSAKADKWDWTATVSSFLFFDGRD